MNPEYGQEGTSNTKKRRRNEKSVVQKTVVDKSHKIWDHILSRLPLKTLMVCRSVCKSWTIKINRIKHEIKSWPLDGFLLRSSSFGETNDDNQTQLLHICYISITIKKTIPMQLNSPNSLIVGSNYDNMGLLGNLCSEFGGLHVQNTSFSFVARVSNTNTVDNKSNNLFEDLFFDFGGLQPNSFFAIHRGLLLVMGEDGIFRVHNPTTRKVFILPKSPVFKEYGDNSVLLEKTGFIIKLYSPFRSASHYMVVRVCRVSSKVEVYKSYRKNKWMVISFSLEDDLMKDSCWCWENYAFMPKARTLCFLTDKDRGVAVRLETGTDVRVYGLGLPLPVKDGFKNARIGTCEGCLYISYYNSSGVWIWKHVDGGCTTTMDAWAPLLEINQAWVCRFMDNGGGDSVIIPMGFHSEIAVVFLRVKSLIFAYDMSNNTIHEIGELDDQVFGESTIALPFSPCLISTVAKKANYLAD